ncbi:MAG: hypothetical protein DCC71_06800 [Proteobacteria bacterium]|nr:MAG: hypothetical protein DCC71_06800 [Pseudomonadota bacterium]
MSADLDRLREELAEIEQRIAEQKCVTSPTAGRVDDVDLLKASSLHRKIADAEQASATAELRSDADATVPEPVTEPPPTEEPRGDTGAALDFLERWRPGGPWAATAISTDKKSIETTTFDATKRDRLAEWVERHNGTRNIYFMVNSATRRLTKKADREDVAALDWLHVDIDPRAGEDIEAEQNRALAMLRNPPDRIPPPTVIVFSGGGYQGFWKLSEPLLIEGDLAKAEEAKRFNLTLELAFGGDHCHNVDRIMRLPGTINVPDKVKLRKGRVPTVAKLVEWHEDRVYDLSQFTAAMETKPSSSAAPVQISGTPNKIADTNELDRWGVPERVKVIIVQGDNRGLEGPKQGDDSRSAWLFDALCNLARCGVPDDVMYSIVMDEAFGISASVLDKGPRAEKYALRQIAQAKAAAAEPLLEEMNSKFFVVEDEGAKCRVAFFREKAYEERQVRQELVLQSFPDFRNRFMNRQIEAGRDKNGNPKFRRLGDWWLEHSDRRQYRQIDFLPGREAPEGVFNLWRGFAVEPTRGSWRAMQRHIWVVLARRERAAFRYIMRWAAWAVQNPERQAEVALVFRGARGTGKGTFARWVKNLFGQHGLQIMSSKHLVGNFNAHLRDCALLFADEAIAPEDRAAEGVLKGFLTEPTLPIEGKNRDLIEAPNHLHVIMASNDDWVVPAGFDERRFAVFDASDERKQDKAWFGAIDAEMRGGGAAAMLHDLLGLRLDKWHPRDQIPQTAALARQKAASLQSRPVERVWFEMLQTGELPTGRWLGGGAVLLPTKKLLEEIERRTRRADITANKVQALLGEVLGFTKRDDGRPRGWEIPALPEARERWGTARFAYAWGDADEWQLGESVGAHPADDHF